MTQIVNNRNRNYEPKLVRKQKININVNIQSQNKNNGRSNLSKLVPFNYMVNANNGDDMSPLSGSEPEYDPKRWNDNLNIKNTHNCYSYVLNKIVSSRVGKPQPGFFSGFQSLRDDEYSCNTFLKRLRKDIPSLIITDFKTPCPKGTYKGFIAIDPKKEDPDYHFYRQDKNRLWSHKPGRSSAINFDASGVLIKNPLKANRKYEHFDYNIPCFFFCVNPKLARSSSTTHKQSRNPKTINRTNRTNNKTNNKTNKISWSY
jgi:hypothetical protein